MAQGCYTYLHDLAILVAVEGVQLVGLVVVGWGQGSLRGGASHLAPLLLDGLTTLVLTPREGVRQGGLHKHTPLLSVLYIKRDAYR